ncbi:S-adenosylmethionine:tRNA ribosyltransferase-isomerase [Terrimonas sp. NA20]|uniref:S-adenosylmethionine:tRNA ribosyltransferase-isomerase n=1 Tax=Terrimonas ginsenosidimutans TaxID=2908004 RepID=A0ABS9KW00_9BACT|nr:S-adenosylmethionine:tRNA ribosyltransferase-isomerase [Terrimonas ginsenosidimutans]MCG2616480.1 S-adenosylmethionine:tRNA ribosyltransferase-isomerase [Terrimonas ginsenosidimutans]
MHPKHLSIAEFTYELPNERIAEYPVNPRDQSKLLCWENGLISEDIYANISDHLPENSLLIFNNTKVVEARLLFQKPTGGVIEIFCLEPHEQYTDITTALQQTGTVWWHCLVGGASKWKPGQVLQKNITTATGELLLEARYVEKKTGSFIIELSWRPADKSFAELLHLAGAIPLPPYIKRKAESPDNETYQTIYAKMDGSVAAPTAGLHFTNDIFAKLRSKNINTAYVTLHVGAGTFKPVKADVLEEHEMHAEFIDVSIETIRQLAETVSHHQVIPVGTTSMRTIESLYWLGVKASLGEPVNGLSQWEVYDLPVQDMDAAEALKQLIRWMELNKLQQLITKTQIIIAPGYKFRIAKGLVTNFHQPQSTLLLLIAALAGKNWKTIYQYALDHNFRFLSYGDGCLMLADRDKEF